MCSVVRHCWAGGDGGSKRGNRSEAIVGAEEERAENGIRAEEEQEQNG